MMNEREMMIRYCYRLLLNRWPSEEEWINCPYQTIEELVDSMLLSDEFYNSKNKIINKIIARKFLEI